MIAIVSHCIRVSNYNGCCLGFKLEPQFQKGVFYRSQKQGSLKALNDSKMILNDQRGYSLIQNQCGIIQNLQRSPVHQTNNWQRTSFGRTEHTTGSSCMSLPFSSQLPSVITISLTYERKKYIYRTFFATQLPITNHVL